LQTDRFDALTRSIGSRTSRRLAIGLAATGLLSIAMPDAEAARCSKQDPSCPECRLCKRHRCRPDASKNDNLCTDGTCLKGTCCPPERTCGDVCCASGKECGGNGRCTEPVCPAGAQFCTDENIQCGSDCYCVTGKSRGTICGGPFTSLPCAECTADADCDSVTGPGSVCLDVVGECFCDTGPAIPTVCMPPCPG
jgi:hypothetical protein